MSINTKFQRMRLCVIQLLQLNCRCQYQLTYCVSGSVPSILFLLKIQLTVFCFDNHSIILLVTRKHFTMKLNLLPHVNVEDWKRCFSFYPTFHSFSFPFPLLLLCQITISWPCLTCHVVKNIQHVINFQLAMPRLSRGLVIIIP